MSTGNALGIVLVWYLAALGILAMPVPVAIVWIALLAGSFWWLFMRPGSIGADDATMRLRGPGDNLRLVALASIVFVLVDLSLIGALIRLVPHPTSDSTSPIDAYQARPYGRLVFAVMSGVHAPLLEEYAFRGVLLGRLQRKIGSVAALVTTSLLFAFMHGKPWLIPDYFVFGLAAGVLVIRTGSLWSGVILHGVCNLALNALGVLERRKVAWVSLEHGPEPTWLFVVLLLVGAGVFLLLLRALVPPVAAIRATSPASVASRDGDAEG